MRFYQITGTTIAVLNDEPASVPKAATLVQSAKDFDSRRFPSKRLTSLLRALPGSNKIPPDLGRDQLIQRLWTAMAKVSAPHQPRSDSKKAKLIQLLEGKGQSLGDLEEALGWQAHTIRATISRDLRKKLGLNVEWVKSGNDHVYRIA